MGLLSSLRLRLRFRLRLRHRCGHTTARECVLAECARQGAFVPNYEIGFQLAKLAFVVVVVVVVVVESLSFHLMSVCGTPPSECVSDLLLMRQTSVARDDH